MKLTQIITGDCRKVLKTLPDKGVHCCVTSPPYWGLRDYGVKEQLGLEKTPEEYVVNLVGVFAEVRRVLRDDGTLWLNLGDSYHHTQSNNGGYSEKSTLAGFTNPTTKGRIANDTGSRGLLNPGCKHKDLIGIPWRVAFALQADGWYLRSDIIWHKQNPMPESVTDRPTKAHEYIFLLAKSERYYYDAAAVAEPLETDPDSWGRHSKKDPGLQAINPRAMFGPGRGYRDGTEWGNRATRNRRSVWTIATEPYSGSHFAAFPTALIRPCILAGCPPGGIVLDPFAGSGTVGQVAQAYLRKSILIELNPKYIKLINTRNEMDGLLQMLDYEE